MKTTGPVVERSVIILPLKIKTGRNVNRLAKVAVGLFWSYMMKMNWYPGLLHSLSLSWTLSLTLGPKILRMCCGGREGGVQREGPSVFSLCCICWMSKNCIVKRLPGDPCLLTDIILLLTKHSMHITFHDDHYYF